MAIPGAAELGRRIAVYGEIDPNLVDGSSVWLQSVCQVLASIDGVAVTLLLRRPLAPERRFLFDELDADDRIEIVEPPQTGLLAPEEALDFLEALEGKRGRFDPVLLRGKAVLTEAAGRGAFDGRLWSYAMTGRGIPDEVMRELGSCSARLLCQTDAVADELRQIVPEANGSILVLPPMIPDGGVPVSAKGKRREGGPRLVYAGKLAPEYCWLETVEAFRALRLVEPDAELHVLGDKVHRPPEQPSFHEQAMRALCEIDGLHWHGAVARASVPALLAECDLALSVRDPAVEGAREISTKVLEYGAAGLPVVLNRAPAYERLLGEDYPLFVERPEDAAGLLNGSALDPGLRARAATACRAAAAEFTFNRVAARLAEHLPAAPPTTHPTLTSSEVGKIGCAPRTARPPRVLIAGHDLKFTAPIREAITAAGAEVVEDVWHNHTEHDEAASRAALEETDVILCEWCLGNAAWYSRNKRSGQRLVVRLHRMEVYTDHPAGVEIDNVDQVVCVSQHIADEAIERFGWDPTKLSVIPNSVDVDRFQLPKKDDARHTLAMVGYVPRRKRLDRALEVLEELRRRDPRFHLLLIGHPPSEFDWVARDPGEVEFFRRCYSRIQKSDELRGGVAFLSFTEDLPWLFQRVGLVLSTSGSEGHQVALAEGAASGAAPVILERPGAVDQYPDRWIHPTPADAASWIGDLGDGEWRSEGALAADHAAGWAAGRVLPRWLLAAGLGALPPGSDVDRERILAGSNPEC